MLHGAVSMPVDVDGLDDDDLHFLMMKIVLLLMLQMLWMIFHQPVAANRGTGKRKSCSELVLSVFSVLSSQSSCRHKGRSSPARRSHLVLSLPSWQLLNALLFFGALLRSSPHNAFAFTVMKESISMEDRMYLYEYVLFRCFTYTYVYHSTYSIHPYRSKTSRCIDIFALLAVLL